MLKARTVSLTTIALISVVGILVIAPGMAAYNQTAPLALSVPVPTVTPPAENIALAPVAAVSPAVENIAPASVSANSVAAHGVYMSEQMLRRWLDDAYERHQATRVQTLLRILNGRYEHRCCGLPR